MTVLSNFDEKTSFHIRRWRSSQRGASQSTRPTIMIYFSS